MSLRSFHAFFIVTATLFCFGFGGWGITLYRSGYAPGAWYAALAFAAGVSLIPYLFWFLRSHRAAH